MGSIKNIRLITERGTLDYSESNLGVKLNRVVDDFQKPEKKFTEFSYSFDLPKTKNNTRLFDFPDTKGRTGIFVNKIFDCRLVCNNEEILNGLIELDSINNESYKCLFYNKFGEFVDAIKGKKLRSLTSLSTIEWNYEKTIVDHIRSNYSYDDTDHQFPFIFYRTFFNDGGITGKYKLEKDLQYDNWISSGTEPNVLYYNHFPPAIYLAKIFHAVVNEAGWNVGGSFFQREDIKKIIIPYNSSIEDYQKAIITGFTGASLNLNKTLIDMPQEEFVKMIIQIFNLYLTINSETKTITFETFNLLFNDNLNPYDITNLVISEITKRKERGNVKISLDSDDNNPFVACYGRIIDYDNITILDNMFNTNLNKYSRFLTSQSEYMVPYNSDVYEKLWQKQGTEGELKLKLSPCNYAAISIRNDENISGTTYTGATLRRYSPGIPFISSQTPTDNKGVEPYEEGDLDPPINMAEVNDASKMKYDGKFKMLYWYNNFSNDLLLNDGSRYYDWVYVNIATGGTATEPTYAKVRVPVASPYQLLRKDEYEYLISVASGFTDSEKQDVQGAEVHNLLLTYQSVGTTGGTHHSNCTNFSLNFSDNENLLFPNLYYFHKTKYDQIQNAHSISMDIRCNENVWREIQINRTIRYDKENYRLVALKNFDIAKEVASITLMKK